MSAPRVATVLITAERLDRRIREMAADIERDSPGEEGIHLVSVLKGGFVFLADLVRHMSTRVTLDFMTVSSYGKGPSSSGDVRLLKDLDSQIAGRDVVIVEGIVDTGLTLAYLQGLLRARRPRRLRSACLLSKPSRRTVAVPVDYTGFEIADTFVVGYGLDSGEHYRNLPYIGTLDQHLRPGSDHGLI